MKKRIWNKVADEMCYCGAKKSEHAGLLKSGPCDCTACVRFTWKRFLDKNGRKVAALVFAFLSFAMGAWANELPDSPTPKFDAVRVEVRRHEHSFYATKTTKIVLAVELGVMVSDTAITCRNLANGGREKFLPTQSCAGIVGYILASRVAGEGLAYFLHKTHHHKLEQLPRLFLIEQSAHGIGYSVANGGTM